PQPEEPVAPAPEDKPSHGQTTRADVTLEAGDSGTVHVAARTLSLRLAFARECADEDGSVEIKTGRERRTLTGAGALVLKVHPGALRYTLRCAGDARGAKPRATGALTIKRDSGNVPVSRRAPVNVIDADGRRYTVLFQTRLPALTLGWAAAPSGAGTMSLHIESAGDAQTLSSPTASRLIASGALAE